MRPKKNLKTLPCGLHTIQNILSPKPIKKKVSFPKETQSRNLKRKIVFVQQNKTTTTTKQQLTQTF